MKKLDEYSKIVCLDIETPTDHKTVRLIGEYVHYCHSEEESFYISPIGCISLPAYGTLSGTLVFTWYGEGFDYPILERERILRRKDLEQEGDVLFDGYIVSKMLYPDRYSHSLESWAKELLGEEEQKLEIDYDNAPLDELEVYLKRDLEITYRICSHLYNEYLKKVGDLLPLRCEQGVRRLVNVTRDRGMGFDVRNAARLVEELRWDLNDLGTRTKSDLPMTAIPKSRIKYPPKKQFKKDGSLSAHMENYLDSTGWYFDYDKGSRTLTPTIGDVRVYQLPLTEPLVTEEQLTLKNTAGIKDWLLSKGWEPTMWNTKKVDGKKVNTSPLLFDKQSLEPCPNMAKIIPAHLYKAMQEYNTKSHRYNTIKGWIEKQEGGVLKGDADSCGTPTARFKHKTIANIPRVTSYLGKEMRGLFGPVNSSNVQVGWDASSLEAVIEAHYVYPYDPEYANTLVSGDVHTRNQKLLGLDSRDTAKTFKYAITYGAYPKRIASTLNCSLERAQELYDTYWEENKGLSSLKEKLKAEWKEKGYITGIDGRPLHVRAEYSLLNTYLQGGGAILMKYAFLIANKRIQEFCDRYFDIETYPLIRYHDEEQWECDPTHAVDIGEIGVQSIVDAGVLLGLNVPITAEYKIGKNWAECH